MLQHGFGSEARSAVTVYRGANFSEHASPVADNYSGARSLFAFSFQPGFYLRDTHVVNGALEFNVLGELGIGSKFNLKTSTDLRTWVPMGLSHKLIDGQNVINDLINPENSYQFFRVVELNGD